MRGFIYIRPLGLGADILVGLAQIATVEPVQRKRRGPYFAELHLGDGRIVACEESFDEVRNAIEDAEFGPEPAAAEGHSLPIPNPDGSYNVDDVLVSKTSAAGAPAPQTEVKKEMKKRGRPPKATG